MSGMVVSRPATARSVASPSPVRSDSAGKGPGMAQLTIDPTTTGFSREVALYLANACDLAYSEDPVQAARALLGLDAEVFRHDASDAQGFVGRAATFTVLAFRGSETINEHPRDWLVDLQFRQTRDAHFTGRVHSGFSTTLSSAWA